MVFRRRGRPTYYVKLPTRTGWEQRSTGTSDRVLAKKIARMIEELGPKGTREWDLLDAVRAHTLTLGALYDAWSHDALDGLRARQADADLTAYLDAWQAWLEDRIADDTASHYLAYLRTLMPEGRPFWRSDLTAPAVARWLATRTSLTQKRRKALKGSRRRADPAPRPLSGGTKRKYLAAVQSFAKYLRVSACWPRIRCATSRPRRPGILGATSSSFRTCSGSSRARRSRSGRSTHSPTGPGWR